MNTGSNMSILHTDRAMGYGLAVMEAIFRGAGESLEPGTVFRAALAALLLAQHTWRPDHVFASSTAIRLDFGSEITQEQELADLRAMVVKCAGGDANVADALVDGFAQIPPRAVRNAIAVTPGVWTHASGARNQPYTSGYYIRWSARVFDALGALFPQPCGQERRQNSGRGLGP
ncbi:hypothetical protein BC828DRAFT_260094 [Blastocladiella britannica]|nr:hypothetical protein BC828DRAFT_260094 [Blastocladiella britannica]